MLRLLMGGGAGCDCKMEVLYVLQVVLSPSLPQSRPQKRGFWGYHLSKWVSSKER